MPMFWPAGNLPESPDSQLAKRPVSIFYIPNGGNDQGTRDEMKLPCPSNCIATTHMTQQFPFSTEEELKCKIYFWFNTSQGECKTASIKQAMLHFFLSHSNINFHAEMFLFFFNNSNIKPSLDSPSGNVCLLNGKGSEVF